uniref:Hyaluronidase n=1 Tax=Biomphalaria glabrata TaxID=6526 RepID=A0A0C9S359_BIOGL
MHSIALIAFLYFTLNIEAKPKGCTGPSILPNKPFVIVWNHPSTACEDRGYHLNFQDWGIIDNKNDKFMGEQISLFYNLGSFPSYHGNVTINGGIPQLANETYHLSKTQNDIKSTLPSSNFSGLAVIDFENWRPIFILNYDSLRIYQTKSLELAKQHFPSYNNSQLFQVATHEFEDSARSVLGKTLSLATMLRPNGSWGYYGYPRCWDTYCNTSTVQFNDQLNWIYNISTGLYPSIYFTLNEPFNHRAQRIKMVVKETLRLKATWSPSNVQLLPYAFSQDGPYSMFNATDLYYAIRLPADMGSSGVVLWGSSDYMRARNECLILQQYLNTTLGPYSLDVTNFFANCSTDNCNGHGRCMKKELETYFQFHLHKNKRDECYIREEHLKMQSQSTLKNKATWGKAAFGNKSRRSKSSLTQQFHQSSNNLEHFNNLGHRRVEKHFKITEKLSGREMADYLDLLEIPTTMSMTGELVYDYNDYVCKCYAGWSGLHCNE